MALTARNILALSSLRFFRHHPLQLGLTLLSIALGTAVVIAVSLANQSARESFARSIAVLSGPMTHEITAQQAYIPDDFYRKLRVEWQYRDSLPFFEQAIQVENIQYRLLAIDPFAYTQASDSALPELSLFALSQLLNQKHSVILSESLAQQWQLQAGDPLKVNIQQQTQTLQVLAVVEDGSWPAETLITDLGSVHSLAGQADLPNRAGGLTHIHLKLTEQQAQTLQARLPKSLQLKSFAQRQDVFAQMTSAFRTNLLAMSLLAVLIGAFLVYNTMTFSVLQRRRSFAIARMLGFTSGQLFRLLLLEALLLGLMGGLLGIFLGYLMGSGLLSLVTRTIADLYVSVSVGQLSVSPGAIFIGLGMTFIAVVIATLGPAREAAQVQPVQVHRWSQLEISSQQKSRYYLAISSLCLSLSALFFYLPNAVLWQGFAGLFLLVLGYSLAVPWLLKVSLHWCQQLPIQHLGFRMVVRGVESSLSRTTVALIALSVAVSATVGVSIMIGSFRASVAEWLNYTLSSDLYISAVSADGARVQGKLDPRWLQYAQSLPTVDSWSTGLSTRLSINSRPIPTLVLKAGSHSQSGFHLLQQPSRAWQDFIEAKGAFISEPLAYHQQKTVGDTVSLNTPDDGLIDIPILGVYQDYSSTQGMLVLPRPLYERYWSDQSISSIGLKIAAGQHEPLKQNLLDLAKQWQSAEQAVVIRSDKTIRERSLEIFDRTFIITYILRALVIIVAFVGILSALMTLFIAKRWEFSVLRAIGFTPGLLALLIGGQALLIGILAGLLAIPLGMILAEVLIHIINQRSFGWTLSSHFFPSSLIQALLLSCMAAVLASIYPIFHNARLSIRAGLSKL